MENWENLPLGVLALVYTYLPRRDRLSCSLVCSQWREGLRHVMLWKTWIVHIDTDLAEPSTIILLRDYCKYVRKLEFGWAAPYRNHKWIAAQYKDFTKRAVRFLLILHDNYVQIHSLRVFNWFDFASFSKVTYHLCRFLKNQFCLKHITFDNINMHSANYIKLLTSCLGSKSSVICLDVKSCYCIQPSFDPIYFRTCIEQLACLRTFKLDYYVLSCRLIDSILTSRNQNLENLEVILKEASWQNRVIDDEQWCLLSSACPNLKVTLVIRNVFHFGEFQLYLKRSIPLVSLSIVLPKTLDQEGQCNFRKILHLLVNHYHRTLETVDLHLKNETEIVDDTVLMVVRRCLKLENLAYCGYIEDLQVLKTAFPDIACLALSTKMHPHRHILLKKVEKVDFANLKHKRVRFSYHKPKDLAQCSLVILN